eukprot:COSAG01_NODE_5285_length_4356_cov_44.815833_2_plen_236_part_00
MDQIDGAVWVFAHRKRPRTWAVPLQNQRFKGCSRDYVARLLAMHEPRREPAGRLLWRDGAPQSAGQPVLARGGRGAWGVDAQPLPLLRVRPPAWRQRQQHSLLSACHCKPPSLLAPPALEAWLCSRVHADTAGGAGGADGGRSAPRSGQREHVPTGNSAGTVHSLRKKSGWSAGCMQSSCQFQETDHYSCTFQSTKPIQMHKTVYFSPNINRVATSHLAVDLTREYSGVSRSLYM